MKKLIAVLLVVFGTGCATKAILAEKCQPTQTPDVFVCKKLLK